MQGHQLHAVLPRLGLALARLQRGVGEKGGQGRHLHLLAVVLEGAGGIDQLLQVFQAGLSLLSLFLFVVGDEAAVLDDVAHLLGELQLAARRGQLFDQRPERPQGLGRARRQVALSGGRRRAPQGYAAVAGQRAHQRQAAVADAARRRVHDPLEGGVVVAVFDQAQIGEGVLDLGALEETQSSVDSIGDAVGHQRLFEYPRLGVGAIEDGHLRAAGAPLHGLAHPVDHKPGLVGLVERRVQRDGLALGAAGPQLLAQAPLVVGDQAVGGGEDRAGGAVVLLQTNGARGREVLGEALDVLDARAAPAIDGLVVVAHDEGMAGLARQQAQPRVLDGVGVLKLVHQDVAEALAVVSEDLGAVAPQLVGAQQQLGEVHQPGALAELLVGPIDADHALPVKVAAAVEVRGAQPLVLLGVDEPLHLARRPARLVELQRAQQAPDHPVLVVGIEDLKPLGQAGVLPVRAQQPVGQPVEGAHPHAAHRDVEHALDATAHLRRSLVGEGHRQHPVGRDLAHGQQPGDAMHQHARLARAGPGQD